MALQETTGPPSPEPAERPTRPRLPLGKRLLFAGVLVLLFFAAAELILAAIGVRPLSYSQDPFVGFTSQSPLFEVVQASDGQSVYRTAPQKLSWFNQQEFPARKQRGVTRIFCLGGSTTYGRPYDDNTSFSGWLREYLAALEPARRWEVVNAGGISYASYRVAAIMEQLIRLEPDLFIIYCGHNEFLERRTYSRLISTPRSVRETAGLLSRSRVYTSIHAMLNSPGEGGSGSSSDAVELPAEVDAILDGSVGPDDYERDDEQRQRTIEHYRFNLARMIEMARSVDARVVLVTPASNESGLSPFKSLHRADLRPDELARWKELVAQASAHREAGELVQALELLDQAVRIDPLYAQTHFDRGRVLFELGRFPESKAAFQLAIDEDVCPLRILSEMRAVLAEVAAEHKVPLVDFQKLMESRSPHGITGQEWFLDHVHPTIDGYQELALSLLEELSSQGTVDPRHEVTAVIRQQVDATVMARVDERAHATALRNLAKVLSWARKYEEAGRLAQRAAATLGDDAEVACMAAFDYERQGKLELAKERYRQALQLRPDYARAHYNLGHVHRRLGEWELAAESFRRAVESDPRFPGAHYNLGMIYAQNNRLDLAAECFQASIAVNEKHPGSWEELGNVCLRQGRDDEAMRYLTTAVRLDPGLSSAHNSLGVVYAKAGQMEKAIAEFERALAISPGFEAALQNLERARGGTE